MNNIQYVTQQRLEQIKSELHQLKTVDRLAISKAISEAREKGDLRENAEYDAAKNDQGMLEAKIKKIENALANSRVINEREIGTEQVSILTNITITNLKTKQQIMYKLVSENEANLKESKLSVISPIGKELLGKRVGDVIAIKTPSGELKFNIDKISI